MNLPRTGCKFFECIYNDLRIMGRGMGGIQGPMYIGTGCFHRRKLIYGFSLDNAHIHEGKADDDKVLKESFGNFIEFIDSVAKFLKDDNINPQDLSNVADQVSYNVAHCSYLHGTLWGALVSVTKDVLTGIRIHSKGWRSVPCKPEPPGFLGTAPTSMPVCLIQRKRWTTVLGLPVAPYPEPRVPFRSVLQFFAGILHFSAIRGPEFPTYAYGNTEVAFEVTPKDSDDDHKDHDDASKNNANRFTFDESPIFIPGTTFLFVHLTALALSLFGHEHDKVGVGEYLYSVLMVLFFWPFVRELFGKGKYGIPLSVVLKSAGFAFILVHLCSKASIG
ncbi:hypothetical protein TIFTF001_044765 [Ficus carica]|uniref:Uncharacterized protein n=1 Tax=Ficus carica TaxID=3494 RepID=A0AA87ZBH5_FICCA|nr:hypothetical protein TIFTF001_044765 [Ficus carica]